MIITALGQRIFVRYTRKPIWMPTAPSKLFRIPELTFYSPEEVVKIRKLQRQYWAQEESVREYMKREFYLPATQAGGLPMEFIKKEEELDKQLYEENVKENARIAKLKEEILGKQLSELEDKLVEEKLRIEDELIENAQEIDEYIKEHKVDSNSFVTSENIETMIEKALENPVSYEFFIDTRGRSYGKGQISGELDVPSKLLKNARFHS